MSSSQVFPSFIQSLVVNHSSTEQRGLLSCLCFGFCYNHGKWPGISKEASLGGLGAWNRRKVAISSLSGFPLGRWVFNSWGSVDRKQEAFLCSSGLVAGGSWGQSRDWSPNTLEPVLPNKRSHGREKSAHHNQRGAPTLHSWSMACTAVKRTQHSQDKQTAFFKKRKHSTFSYW